MHSKEPQGSRYLDITIWKCYFDDIYVGKGCPYCESLMYDLFRWLWLRKKYLIKEPLNMKTTVYHGNYCITIYNYIMNGIFTKVWSILI